jgi:hypothetical protein
MESTLKYDRVVLTRELNDKFKKVGEVFEIANVFDDYFLLRDGKTRVAIGIVSFEDFDKHFVHEANFKGWTQWTPLTTNYEEGLVMFYRVKDRHKVQVKTSDGFVGESSCNTKFGDEFNLYTGLNLAFLRCVKKVFLNRIEKHQKQLNIYENEIKGIEDKIRYLNHNA